MSFCDRSIVAYDSFCFLNIVTYQYVVLPIYKMKFVLSIAIVSHESNVERNLFISLNSL